MTHEFSHLRAGGAGGGIVADPAARPEAIEADAIVTELEARVEAELGRPLEGALRPLAPPLVRSR